MALGVHHLLKPRYHSSAFIFLYGKIVRHGILGFHVMSQRKCNLNSAMMVSRVMTNNELEDLCAKIPVVTSLDAHIKER